MKNNVRIYLSADKTHECPERQERDEEVKRILQEAGVPLLRLQNKGRFEPSELVTANK